MHAFFERFHRDRYLWMIAGVLLLVSLVIACIAPIQRTDNDGNTYQDTPLESLGSHAAILIVGGFILAFVMAAPFGIVWNSRYWHINQSYRRGFVIMLILVYAAWTYFAIERLL